MIDKTIKSLQEQINRHPEKLEEILVVDAENNKYDEKFLERIVQLYGDKIEELRRKLTYTQLIKFKNKALYDTQKENFSEEDQRKFEEILKKI